tara:strand:+ start:104 stop:430 length:327 start_codon:yes stop_codon:yes gene_type:complete
MTRNFSEILETAKQAVVDSGLTDAQVNAVKASQMKTSFGLSDDDADAMKMRLAQFKGKVASFAAKREGAVVWQGILGKLSAKEKKWLKANSETIHERLNPIEIEVQNG